VSDLNTVMLECVDAFVRAGIDYMVVGGMAVIVLGTPRLTVDVDIAVAVDARDPQAVQRLIKILGSRIHEMPRGADEFVRDTGVLPFRHPSGVKVDLGVSENPYALSAMARAVILDVEGRPVKFCSPEDLILHKLLADRNKDRDDIKGLLRTLGKTLDRTYLDPLVEQLADSTYRPEILERYRSLLSTTRS
jgi:hypothetical protein